MGMAVLNPGWRGERQDFPNAAGSIMNRGRKRPDKETHAEDAVYQGQKPGAYLWTNVNGAEHMEEHTFQIEGRSNRSEEEFGNIP